MNAETESLRNDASVSLKKLIAKRAFQRDIEGYLNALSAEKRLAQMKSIGGSDVGKLYDLVASAAPLALTDIVPENETGTVILEGKNSLPAFSHFQKRFYRKGDTILGYNHQTMSPITGPGYFIVRPPTSGEPHPDELFFDYTTDPPEAPAGWPAFKPNDAGLSRLVYMNMKDYCRRVANGVLVGKAYKLGVAQGAYFTLTRPY